MYIFSPGEKIKRLRREIGLKQDQLTDDQITRSLISMIENEKRNLSEETAEIIATRLTRHYESYGKVITANYLLESKEDQVKNIIDTQLISLTELMTNYQNLNSDHVFNIFNKLLTLAEDWSIKEHYAKTLLVRGDYHFSINRYNDALMDFFNCLDYYLGDRDNETTASIYNKIGSSFLKKGFVDEGLLYYNKACAIIEVLNTNSLNSIKILSTYNMISCYRRLKKFDLVFKYVSLFKELKDYNENLYSEVLLMEANTYYDLGIYEKAKIIYDELLTRNPQVDSNILLTTYNQLAKIYHYMGNSKESQEYTQKIDELIENHSITFSSDVYCALAKYYCDLSLIDKALSLLDKGFRYAKIQNNLEAMISIKLLIADIYREHIKDYDEAESHILYLEEHFKNHAYKDKHVEVYAKIAKFYCLINNPARCIKYLDKIHV
ncbi:helix-turn-helix domain-containing protein [Alkaliphilus transvaalensis]|uniref:helix-turn-helix domain-containing protein n=1 Tax=Alkaliphilus transvaalensis TaxID=114628 RepID=UPI00047E5D5C|nr:helix-turn-helix transcriptional regulator [Alkaliphilus transvaalensis]